MNIYYFKAIKISQKVKNISHETWSVVQTEVFLIKLFKINQNQSLQGKNTIFIGHRKLWWWILLKIGKINAKQASNRSFVLNRLFSVYACEGGTDGI